MKPFPWSPGVLRVIGSPRTPRAGSSHGVRRLPPIPRSLLLFTFLLFLPLPTARAQTYHLLKQIPIGGEGGWDYLACDADADSLYVSHGDKIVVINTQTDIPTGEIADMPGVHGFAIAPDLKRGFSSNGKEDKASIVDLATLKTVAKVDTGKDPDAILYASGPHEVYTFNGKGNSATVFDATSGQVVATIALPGKPEFAVYDPAANRVYDNIEDKNEVIVIDAKTHQIVNTWPLKPGESPSGLALDHDHQRLFIGCRNRLMLMMDAANGTVLTSVPIGEKVDATAFDPGSQLAFSSCGDGTLTVAYEDAPDKLIVVQVVMTDEGARTMAFDPKLQKIYLATADFETPAPGMPPPERPVPIRGSFKVLVYVK
jgi:DNA-binding beta-propeller fold protein YncE